MAPDTTAFVVQTARQLRLRRTKVQLGAALLQARTPFCRPILAIGDLLQELSAVQVTLAQTGTAQFSVPAGLVGWGRGWVM